MVALHTQQILSITLPTVAIFLSYLWFRRKRISGQSDPGESSERLDKTFAVELYEIGLREVSGRVIPMNCTPLPRSEPINIAPKSGSQRSSPAIISDEDLDQQIEKVKRMKSTVEPYSISKPTDTFDGPPRRTPPSALKPARKQESAVSIKSSLKKSVKIEAAPSEERRSSDRDSANHSPAEPPHVSFSLGSNSDNSEGSSDSGKGGSNVASPPPLDPYDIKTHEFLIPQHLVGKLIGRSGCVINNLMERTNTNIYVRSHPNSNKNQVCAVEGTQDDIVKALNLIRNKFPYRKFPSITLDKVIIVEEPMKLTSPDHLYLKLVEGVNNDTKICSVVSPDHLFVQQPTHPTYPFLQILTRCMSVCYNNDEIEVPSLPTTTSHSTVCVAYSSGEWFRAMILSSDPEAETSYVTFLDVGGFYTIENKNLKQIRGDMLLLPFQSAECYLSNIKPAGGEWCEEAFNLVTDLGRESLVLTQIADYTESGIPLVLMYILVGNQKVVFLNDELVRKGYAEHITKPEGFEEGAVGGNV